MNLNKIKELGHLGGTIYNSFLEWNLHTVHVGEVISSCKCVVRACVFDSGGYGFGMELGQCAHQWSG